MLGHHMLISGNLYLIFFSLSRVCARYSMFNAITEPINVSTVIIIINFDIHKNVHFILFIAGSSPTRAADDRGFTQQIKQSVETFSNLSLNCVNS